MRGMELVYGISLADVEWQGLFVGLSVWRGGAFRGNVAVFVIDMEEIDKGTLEEGFPDGRALREIRQEVDNETIARLEPRQPGTGAVYEEVDMNGETEMPKVRKAADGCGFQSAGGFTAGIPGRIF